MSLMDRRPYTFDRVVRLALTVALAYGAYLLLRYLQSVLVPFAIALLLAYLFEPLVRFYQVRLRFKNRILAIVSSLITVGGVFTLAFVLIAPIVSRNVQRAGNLIAKVVEDSSIDQQARELLPENLWESIQQSLDDPELIQVLQTDQVGELTTAALQRLLPQMMGIFSGALDVLLGILGLSVVLLYLIFILLDFEVITNGWHSLVPHRYRQQVEDMVHDFGKAMSTYFRAQSLIATCVGILFAIGFSLISLPLAILFGLFVGLLNMVPYLQNVAMIPAAFLALIHSLETGQSFWVTMGLVLLVFAVVQTIQDFFLTPKIMGDATGLNPAMILLSLSIWGRLLGILGLIIALPMTFLILSYYRKFLRETNAKQEGDPTQLDPGDPVLAAVSSKGAGEADE